jgi:redox-sensing transcriptional repressor
LISKRTIGRLSLYRRLLEGLASQDIKRLYSHQLAAMAGSTAAQVRRDLMMIGFTGSPAHGYDVPQLIGRIGSYLDAPDGQGVALVGVGNLGRAIIAYVAGRRPKIAVTVAFDRDPEKAGRVIHGCRCHSMAEMAEIVRSRKIRVAVITVPAVDAQSVADRLIAAGVRGFLNFAPVPLVVPGDVTVEQIDITTSLELVAHFAWRASENLAVGSDPHVELPDVEDERLSER